MYFAKEFLLNIYKKLSELYPGEDIEKQGGTQFVSELKYFLAMDEFKKKKSKTCDTKIKDDKDFFVKCVGSVVYLSTNDNGLPLCTKNFANSIGESKDYDVGSNFFSTNAVKNSSFSSYSVPFPNRHPVLLSIRQGKIDIAEQAYNNISKDKNYLGNSFQKFAILFVWLNRYSQFPSKDSVYLESLNKLSNKYSSKLVDCLSWKSEEVKKCVLQILSGAHFSENPYFLTKNDFNLVENNQPENKITTSSSFVSNHSQIIFYGVPGCGKSHKVDEIINKAVPDKDDRPNQIIRVVFHPDYTNSDFVGQIVPYINDGIEYRFKAGPFTRILKHAYKEHNKKFFLVIEELNRGNAAAIFGDLFQLLDRRKDGFSAYSINNPDMASFIMSEDNYHNDKTVPLAKIVGGDKWILDTPIRLPPNLSILATMNTSDQNVFTLDNAFQRRWDMKYLPNKIDYQTASAEQKNQFDSTIGATNIKWGVFRDVVNEFIANPENSFSNAEDKQLGLFFINADADISENSGKIPESDFANKVLKYLWNDIFKRRLESSIFNENIKTFGELISAFNGEKAFENCFDGDFVKELKNPDVNKELAKAQNESHAESGSASDSNADIDSETSSE